MVRKKSGKRNSVKKTSRKAVRKSVGNSVKKRAMKKFSGLKMAKNDDVARDFAIRVYERFNKMVKSVVLFGSSAKKTAVSDSDIDVMILIDDVSIKWDQKLIVWYREELEEILKKNSYGGKLHINTVKLSTWWDDLLRGDPVVINIIRYGESLIDFGGFFEPLKYLFAMGKIKSTPEAIYSALQRAPRHIARSKVAELGSIDGLYWAMVDASHAALIAENAVPPSPEHIPSQLREIFVSSRRLKSRYVDWYRDLLVLHKKIAHGEIKDLKGVEIDTWQERTEEFLKVMARLVEESVGE